MEETETGESIRRLDYEAKITGRAEYLADMKVPGMCHGKILRSPHPHARIRSLDTSKALSIRGVLAVLTRDDIVKDQGIDPYYGPVFKDQTIVAVEKVRHVGDPVAAVAALEPEAAEEALSRIEIDYEESNNPNLTGLQSFIDAYRSVLPYAFQSICLISSPGM